MVREAKVSKFSLVCLKGDAARRDDMLITALRLTPAQLLEARQGSLGERIIKAARMVYLATGDPSQITQFTLSAIVSNGWEDPHLLDGQVASCLSRMFRKTRLEKGQSTGLNLTNMQLLRESIGAYNGNLYEARHVWANFQPGRGDWLRSVRIPTEVGFREAIVLGTEWATGYISKSYGLINLTGDYRDFDFYRNINGIIGIVHGITGKLNLIPRTGSLPGSARTYRFESCSVVIFSKAIATWLVDDLGFGCMKGNILPAIYWNTEAKKGFFMGVIAAKGILTRRDTLEIADKNRDLIAAIVNVAKSFSFAPTTSINHRQIGQSTHMLWFSKTQVKRMLEEGWFLNPKHILDSHNK